MRKFFLLGLFFVLSGCVFNVGDFGEDRNNMYKGGTISDVCDEEPALCDLDSDTAQF